MWRHVFAAFKFAVTLSLMASATGQDVENGGLGTCQNDSDCVGNLDCIRTGLFEKHCFPVTCAKGAAHALVDYGFNAEEYIATIQGRSGLRRNRDFMSLGESGNKQLSAALASYPPPMEVFQKNFTACLNPGTSVRRELQSLTVTRTHYGLMWSLAGLFSYFGKSTWLDDTIDIQIVSNCVGALVGADVGLDFLAQIFTFGSKQDAEDAMKVPYMESGTNEISVNFDVSETQYVPVITLGPIGVQVGWFPSLGADRGTITEVTLGPSLGAALGGFNQCYNSGTAST